MKQLEPPLAVMDFIWRGQVDMVFEETTYLFLEDQDIYDAITYFEERLHHETDNAGSL